MGLFASVTRRRVLVDRQEKGGFSTFAVLLAVKMHFLDKAAITTSITIAVQQSASRW